MLRTLLPASTILCAILLPLAGHAEQLDELISPNLELPSSDTTFPDGPGADAMNGNCLACHSADHTLNQPTLPRNDLRLSVRSSWRTRMPAFRRTTTRGSPCCDAA